MLKPVQKSLEDLVQHSIDRMSDHDAIFHIGVLIDASYDERSLIGTDRAFVLLDELQRRVRASDVAALVHYLRANAWENRRLAPPDQNHWAWEQPECQEQILELRRAIRHEGFNRLPDVRQCQILTNLANQLDSIGRFIEAIEFWDRALQLNQDFAMALGNRGVGLSYYARVLYDPGHAGLMQMFAHDSLVAATSTNAMYESDGYESARSTFDEQRKLIAEHFDIDAVRQNINLSDHSLGQTPEEHAYRTWCLEQRLFINPLNDIGPLPIAAQDVLTLPSLTVPNLSARVPPLIGFFNQMKQEFVSARFLYYDSVKAEGMHFSDRAVLLYNTLDYPAHSLAVEKMRAVFRVAYSLFDKISFFLNAYLKIGHDPKKVTFRSVWYEKKGKGLSSRPLLSRFVNYQNWPLRGLFWLSKDIFEDEFQFVTEPDAEDLNNIRNHLEHKYLQLHQDLGGTTLMDEVVNDDIDQLGYRLSRDVFAAKTLRLLKLTRAALIYLSLAVHCEERLRKKTSEGGLVMPMPLDSWRDEWKE